MPPFDQGFDPLLYPVGSLMRIAAVLKLEIGFVREKARDALGYYPETTLRLPDREVPPVVAACRPYIPKEEEWELPVEDDDDLHALVARARWDDEDEE